MAEYSKIAQGYFTSTGVAKFINLPFIPDQFEIWNKTKWSTATANLVRYALGFPEDAAGAGYALIADGANDDDANFTFTTGAFSFINAGTYQYGPTIALASTFVTQAAQAVVTTVSPHGLQTGDAVLLYGTTAMLQIAGIVYTVTVLSTTTFSINVNSSGFASAATAGFMKKVIFPDLYIPFGTAITAIMTGLTTTLELAVNHSFVVGQEVFFVVPSQWGTTQLDTLVYNTANVVPQQAYVIATTADSITVNVNSTGYTAFVYPTSAVAALGVTPPQVLAIGDQNSGISGLAAIPPVAVPITIPGAFAANTRSGVLIGIGNGTQLMHQTGDVIRWRAIFPDMKLTT